MQCYYDLFTEERQTAVALGFFDGVHKGHRSVIELAVDQKHNGLLPVCLTFSESPKSVISGVKAPYLMTLEDKVKALESIGVEHTVFSDFRKLMHLGAEEFVTEVLIKKLNAKKLFCGFNYRFGKNAEGDVTLLQKLCVEHHIALTVVPPETDGGEVVCSTLIRRLIAEGNIRRANSMLSGTFGVREAIRHGMRLGHRLGTPTLNQPLTKGLVVPKFGVYASRVTLENGERYCGVTNIGIKPTVGGTTPLWETWMPDYHGGEIYGETADVRLLDYIREEKKFDDLTALKDEIIKNAQKAAEIYQSLS